MAHFDRGRNNQNKLPEVERRKGVLYTFEGFLWMRRGGVCVRCVAFAVAWLLKATLVSARVRCSGRWLGVAAFPCGCAVMRLRFCAGALWWVLSVCGCVSLRVRCDAFAFLRGCPAQLL